MSSFAGQAAAAIENARCTPRPPPAGRQSIIRSMSSALIAVDGQRIVTTWNPAAEQLTGIDLEQATGGRSMRLSPASSRRRLQTLSVQAENDDQTMMVGRGWSGNWGRKSGVSTRPGSRYCRAPVVLRRARGSSSLINDLTKVVRL
ncbi:MAG: PAS domain-containing protein [Thermomicrobiales bacterium]